MLVSGRMWSSLGPFLGVFLKRRAPAQISSQDQNVQKLHTKSPLRAKAEEEESSYRGSFYVAGAKARNPMKRVGLAWAIGFPSGILLFLFAKNRVDQKRVEQMKSRQRMRDANKGEYKSERYSRSA